MARWENEDVSDLNIPDPVKSVTKFIGLKGEEAEEEQGIAKSVISSDSSRRFYIKYGRGEILDPYQIDSSYAGPRRQVTMYKFRRVPESAFDNYIKYLETKNRIFFTKARRILMEN
jgi:hypothetical protein|tara:strand:+ start:1281 stop:1628 length:348 start_codon:yes stop_codon:yes gene_type:complete